MTKRNVLIIDDEEINHFIYQKIMSATTWIDKIEWARNGKQALEMLTSKCSKIISIPDLILLDLQMPLMNGIQFIEGLKDLPCYKSVKERTTIAIVSSSVNPQQIKHASDLGIRHFVDKPLTAEKLDAITSHLYYICV